MIKQAIGEVKTIEKVVLYGSRAKGDYQNGSDIDITIFGKKLTLHNSIYPLMEKLDELYLPYSFDISIFEDIESQDLKEHIGRVGRVLFGKNSVAED